MPRLFFGNFSFEHELAGRSPDQGAGGARLRQAIQGLSAGWIAVAEPDDVILTPEPVVAGDLEELEAMGRPLPRFVPLNGARQPDVEGELVPWGSSAAMSELGKSRGWRVDLPPPEVVRQANSRRQRFELEEKFGAALPGMRLVESLSELEEVVHAGRDTPRGWILKANFGMAGRESVRGRGSVLPEPTVGWARSRLQESGCVIFEPVVAPIAEAGIQLDVPRAGMPTVVGIIPQIVGPGGTYRGSRFGNPVAETAPWKETVPFALAAAEHLQQLGYFGPLGIDAMWYRDADGQAHLRPLQDLNARYTMGRLALGWSRWLPTGWCGSWLPTTPTGPDRISLDRTRVRVVESFPASWKANGGGATLIFAASPEVRAEVERKILRVHPPAD